MGWVERRRQEAQLIALAERYGPQIDPLCTFGTAGLSRREKIDLGREVTRAMASFERMRAAGVVETFDGVEMPTLGTLLDAVAGNQSAAPSISRQVQAFDQRIVGPRCQDAPGPPGTRPTPPPSPGNPDSDAETQRAVAGMMLNAAKASDRNAAYHQELADKARAAGDMEGAERHDETVRGYIENAAKARDEYADCLARAEALERRGAI